MLHFILTLNDKTKKTVTFAQFLELAYLDEDKIMGDLTELLEEAEWRDLAGTEEPVKVQVVMEDFHSDLKKLSVEARSTLCLMLNDSYPNYDDLSDLEVKILQKYAKEVLGEIPRALSDNSVAMKDAEELLAKLEKAKPGDKEEIYQELEPIVKQLFRRGSLTIRDDFFLRLASVAKGSNIEGIFSIFEEIRVLEDDKTTAKTKAELINTGIGIHRIPYSILKSVAPYLSDEVKASLIKESRFSPEVIRDLKFFNKKLFKEYVQEYNTSEETWATIVELYQPTNSEMKEMASHNEAFSTLLDLGFITKENLTDEMLASDPAFFLELPWVKKDDALLIRMVKVTPSWRHSDTTSTFLKLGRPKVESAVIQKSDKSTLARNFSLLSDEGKQKAKAKMLEELKSSEAEVVLGALAGMLTEKEAEKVEKLAVKTIDGAVETMKNSVNPTLRKLALTRLLGSEAQREKVLGLNPEYNFADDEITRISEWVKERDLSVYELKKVAAEILLKDQKGFESQLMTLIQKYLEDSYSHFRFPFELVDEKIILKVVKKDNGRTLRGLLVNLEQVTAEKAAYVLSGIDFDLNDHLELIQYKEELKKVNKCLPKDKKLKGLELLTKKPEAFTKKSAVYIATHSEEGEGAAAVEWIMSQPADEFEEQEIRQIARKLEEEQLAKFISWAKKNMEFFSHELHESGYFLDLMLTTEEEMKQAIYLFRSQNEKGNVWVEKRILEVAASKFPSLVLTNKELLASEEVSPEDLFIMVLKISPSSVVIAEHREFLLKSLQSGDLSLSRIMALKGTVDEKFDLYIKLRGKEVKDAVMTLLSFEETREAATAQLPKLLKLADLKPVDLFSRNSTAHFVNDMEITDEDLADAESYELENLYEKCPKHKDRAFEAIYSLIVKNNRLDFYIERNNSIAVRALDRLTPEQILKLSDLSRVTQDIKNENVPVEIRKKVEKAVNLIKPGVRVKVKAVMDSFGPVIYILNNEELNAQFGGDAYRGSIVLSVPVERAMRLMSRGSSLDLFGVTAHVDGFPELHIDIDEDLAKQIVKNGNKEINEIVKEKSRKIIEEKNLLASLKPSRKWMLSVMLAKDEKRSNQYSSYYQNKEAVEAIQKGLADTHNQTKNASEVKDSPLLKNHQSGVWGVPRFRSGGRRSYYSREKSRLAEGEVLSPVYKGAAAVNEVTNVLDRLTEEVEMNKIVLKVDMSDIQSLPDEARQQICSLFEELEPLLVISGAFSGGGQVWGDSVMDSIEPFIQPEGREIFIKIEGRFSNGKGIAKTIGLLLGMIEQTIQAIIARREKVLEGELSSATELREVIERNLDMKAVMRSALMFKTLAGQKMLFAA